MTQWLASETLRRPQLTHNQLVPGSSPGGTTFKPSKSLTMRVLFFTDPLGVPNGVPSLGNFQQKKG